MAARKSVRKSKAGSARGSSRAQTSALPAAEILSFLKGTKGVLTWTGRDVSQSLNIPLKSVQRILAILHLEGYIEPVPRTKKWRTTEAGAFVSGAKSPRFTRESVEAALARLQDRLKAINEDPNAPYKVLDAVAFGDFLKDGVRLQAPDVGIRLAPRQAGSEGTTNTDAHSALSAFLKELWGRSSMLHLQLYEPWMGARSHRVLI